MSDLKEISLDEYYDYYELKIIKIKDQYGTKKDKYEFLNPKIGKVYRNPIVNITTSRTVTVTKIIGIEKQKVQYFEYAYPPEIKRLHIEEIRLYIKIKEDK